MDDSADGDDIAWWESQGVTNGRVAWVAAGLRVQLRGLQKRPELNGLVGRATAQASSGRWGVALDRGGPGIAVSEENLCRPEEPLPKDSRFKPGDRVVLSGVRQAPWMNTAVGTVTGAATAGRWVVNVDSAPQRLLAVGSRHLSFAVKPTSLWERHVALRGAVLALCSNGLDAVRPRLWSFLRDPTEMALLYPVDGLQATIYSMQAGSVLRSVDDADMSEELASFIATGLAGPHFAHYSDDKDYMNTQSSLCWLVEGANFTPKLCGPSSNDAHIFRVGQDRRKGRILFRRAGKHWITVASVEGLWIARVWSSGVAEVHRISDVHRVGQCKFEAGEHSDVNDLGGFSVFAHKDCLLMSLFSIIMIFTVESDVGRLTPRAPVVRHRCMFGGVHGEISFHGNLCAIVSQDAPNTDRGGRLSLYSTAVANGAPDEPLVDIKPRRLPLIVDVVLDDGKIFTREFCMRVLMGNEFEIVVRSLADPLGAPLFVLQSELVAKPDTRLFCRPGVAAEVDALLAALGGEACVDIGGPTRPKRLQYLLTLLQRRGDVVAKEIRKRIKRGRIMWVKQIYFDVPLLQEALITWESQANHELVDSIG